jgi:hypothetical protein
VCGRYYSLFDMQQVAERFREADFVLKQPEYKSIYAHSSGCDGHLMATEGTLRNLAASLPELSLFW